MGKHKGTDPCPQLTEMEQPHGIILLKENQKKKHSSKRGPKEEGDLGVKHEKRYRERG